MIRPFEARDLPALQRLHADMGLDYALPDKFFSLVLADSNDEPEQALLFRPTAEMFYLLNHESGTPESRWQNFLALHEETRKFVLGFGLTEVEAFLPPEVEARFGKRLMSVGWEKNLWACYTRDLNREVVPLGARAKAS